MPIINTLHSLNKVFESATKTLDINQCSLSLHQQWAYKYCGSSYLTTIENILVNNHLVLDVIIKTRRFTIQQEQISKDDTLSQLPRVKEFCSKLLGECEYDFYFDNTKNMFEIKVQSNPQGTYFGVIITFESVDD